MWVVGIAISILIGVVGPSFAQQEDKQIPGADPDPSVVEQIERFGGKVLQIAQNVDGFEVYFHLGRNHDGLRRFEDTKPDTPEPPGLDSELGVLKKLPNVVSLNLGGTDVTDKGLTHLASLTSLTRLHLEKARVSDSGLAHLKNLRGLTYLNLYGTNVSDEGLRHLEGFKNLRKLYLWQTKATPAGVKKLQQILPNCEINLGSDVQKILPPSE